MTGLEKAAVDGALRKAVARLEGGRAGQGDMATLVSLTTVERMAQPLGVSTSDVVWSWVGEMLQKKDPIVREGVERTAQGTGEWSPGWAFHAMQRCGWARKQGMTEGMEGTMRKLGLVLGNVCRVLLGKELWEWGGMDRGEVLRLETKAQVARLWQVTKGQYRGRGGKGRMRKMVATLMVGGWVEGTLCCAPGDDGWWLEAKKLAADIKRRAVARVLTDEDSGEVGEVLGDVEVAEGLEAGADCEWGEAWESMRSQVWEADGEGVDWGEPGAGVEGEVWPPKVDSGELTTEEYDGRVTPEEVTGPLTVHEEGVGRLGRARGARGGSPDWVSPSFSGGVRSPMLHRISRPMGSLGDESSSGDTTDLGGEEGACLCSTRDQVWETTGVDTGGETVQGALYPKQGLGGAGAKRRKVAVKPGSVGAWVTKVGGPEVAARLTGHQGWGLQGEEGETGEGVVEVATGQGDAGVGYGDLSGSGVEGDPEGVSDCAGEESEWEEGWRERVERWKAPGRGMGEGGVARGEGLGRPAKARMTQAEGVAQKACWEDLGKAPFRDLRPGGPLPIMVVLDWMAGGQSLKKTVAGLTQEEIKQMSVGSGHSPGHHKGIVYVGLDKQEWWYSHAMQGWVRNVPVDLMKVGYQEILEIVQGALDEVAGRRVEMTVVLLAMSPCCRTFSRADSSNTGRGHNYRLHGVLHWRRPPKDNTSDKGRAAHAADRMVQQGVRVATAAHRAGVPFYMENPVGSLWRRPYMTKWVKKRWVVRATVHYCAFGHFYHKPTHLWTNMGRWAPGGATGTGLCGGKCGMMHMRGGRWVHRYRISQDSRGAHGGKGRKAKKNMMPALLHAELLRATGLRR